LKYCGFKVFVVVGLRGWEREMEMESRRIENRSDFIYYY
jgi:hypothetical protein